MDDIGLKNNWHVMALRISNAVAFVAVYATTLLSSRGLIGGGSNSEITRAHPTPITPAGYTFATVWTSIYFFQAILFLGYQFTPSASRTLVVQRIGLWHLAACAFNIGWIFAFSHELMALQCLFIWSLLACLTTIYTRLNLQPAYPEAAAADEAAPGCWAEWLCVRVPWSLYTAWILVASIVDIFVTMPAAWHPESLTLSGIFSLASAVVLSLVVLLWRQDVVFASVVAWALVGVSNRPVVDASVYGACIALAIVMGASCAGTLGLQAVRAFRREHQNKEPNASAFSDVQEPML